MAEPGDQLLHYRLVEKVGQGGMGAVWRARDTSLDRDAAIKILPDELANDPQFLARFQREAKVLASLSHPNLASVFGVHESGGTRFLAMEMVPGEDLSQRLQRGPLPLNDTIAILRRIAEALETAHEKGVVHRDLKPANVRLTPERRVKVLDFGLAKTMEPESADDIPSDSNIALTATGVVLGTAPYMSPEQARGRPVDERTDIWSFGCVLWECLTGERPFPGETVSDLVASILTREPDWSKLPAGTPPSLRRLLRRCLAKSRHDRLRSIADARLELDEAEAELARPASTSPPGAPQRPRLPVIPLVLAGALALAIGALLFPLLREPGGPTLRRSLLADADVRRVTNSPGEELNAAISADGKNVAYLGYRDGEFRAYFGGIEGAEHAPVTPPKGFVGAKYRQMGVSHLGFSRDGNSIWIGGEEDAKLRLVSVPIPNERPWLDEHVIHADWSFDGTRIVYSFATNGDPLYISNPEGGDRRPLGLGTKKGYHQHFPTWSVDDKWIFLVRGYVVTGVMDLWRVRVDGTGLEKLTEDQRDIGFPVPMDDRTVLFLGTEKNGAGPWLWEFDLETRRARRVSFGLQIFKSLHASEDRRRLVATVADPVSKCFRVPILEDDAATEADVETYPVGRDRAVCPRVHGDTLYFLSSVSGRDGLWSRRDGKLSELWTPRGHARLEWAPAISPDGSRIAIVVRDDTHSRLIVLNADGTRPQPMAEDVNVVGGACWSPDGKWIAIGGAQGKKRGLFKLEVSTGEVKQIGLIQATSPVWSPDGSMILYAGPQVGPWQPLLALTPEGTTIELPREIQLSVLGERVRFMPDGSGIAVLEGTDPDYGLSFHSLKTSETRALARFRSSASMRTFDFLPDGKSIVFDRQHDNADIVLIERRDSE